MDEYLLREYLRNRGRDIPDPEFALRMKGALRGRYSRGAMGRYPQYEDDYYVNRHSDGQLADILDELDTSDKEKLFRMMLSGDEGATSGHFDESSARQIVAHMYHTHNGRKMLGEKFDMNKAKEVYDRYREIIPSSATIADVYIAINAQYHDYYSLMKAWFGDNIDTKIIESAVNFWFKDDDYRGSSKVYKYFKEV